MPKKHSHAGGRGAIATRLIPDPKIGGSIPSALTFKHACRCLRDDTQERDTYQELEGKLNIE